MKLSTDDQFKRSILIAAHPDDEILWFSSIIERVHKIIVCYLNYQSDSRLNQGRTQSLAEYPLKNIICLELDESGTFDQANWQNPEVSKYGIDMDDKSSNIKKYVQNYHELKRKLSLELTNCQNVFTHNPWGEYGNEDHVQVYRVVKELQESMSFNLWFSNYCSNKSLRLMAQYVSFLNTACITLKTNKTLSSCIKSLYQMNGCWTWYDNWKWVNEESFFKDRSSDEQHDIVFSAFPLNMIKVVLKKQRERGFTLFRKAFKKRFKKIFR